MTTKRVRRPALRAPVALFTSGRFPLRPLALSPILDVPGKFSISAYGLA